MVKWLFQCGSLAHGWMCKANASTFRARWGLFNEPPMALFGPKLPELSLVRHYAVILVWWNGCSSVDLWPMGGRAQLMPQLLELDEGFLMSHQWLDSDLNCQRYHWLTIYAVFLVWRNACASVVHWPMDGCEHLMTHFLELIKGFQMSHQPLDSDLNCQSYHWLTIMQCF